MINKTTLPLLHQLVLIRIIVVIVVVILMIMHPLLKIDVKSISFYQIIASKLLLLMNDKNLKLVC